MVQRHDDPRGEPNWQPVTAVTMMAGALTEQLAANCEQLELLERARREPWLLDDATVDRVKKVFGVQRDDMWLWEETGRRWQALDLDTATRAQVGVSVRLLSSGTRDAVEPAQRARYSRSYRLAARFSECAGAVRAGW